MGTAGSQLASLGIGKVRSRWKKSNGWDEAWENEGIGDTCLAGEGIKVDLGLDIGMLLYFNS